MTSDVGYVRDRSFYASRPNGGRIKVHRESDREHGMAACDSRYILLDMDGRPFDIAAMRLDCPAALCRRCWKIGV